MWGMGPQPTRHPTALRPNSAHPWFCRWSFTGVQPHPWFLSCFLLSLSPATKAESRSCDKTGDLKRRGELTLWLFKKKFEVPAIKGSVSILPQNHRQLLKVMPFGTVRDYFGGLQNHCRWWLQPWNQKTLAPWKKNYDKPREHIKKQRHHFADKVHLVKAMVFPVVIYECESWTIKKAEHSRIDAFELWYWRRLLRVPWTSRRSNQSILKEINPEYSLEGLMLKLKLQYFGHLMWRTDSLEKTLMLRRIEGRRRKGQ